MRRAARENKTALYTKKNEQGVVCEGMFFNTLNGRDRIFRAIEQHLMAGEKIHASISMYSFTDGGHMLELKIEKLTP